MSHLRWDARRDDVEHELILLARRLGAKLIMGGPLDWWWLRNGQWIPVEIKDPAREGHMHEYTRAQRNFLAFAKEHRGPWLVWRTSDDVIRDLGAKVTA
jgi:hypothetical protein